MWRRVAGILGGRGTAEGGKPRQPWSEVYEPIATEADVLHCFRLLLGRHPNREEWPGHSMRVGEDLPRLVAGYLSSLEFSRRGLTLASPDDHPDIAVLDGFRIFASRHDADVGRHVLADNYERDVAAVFRRLLRPGMGVLDVGANIGFFSMLSASLVGPDGHVTAVEPNPHNARMVEASRRLNGFEHVAVAQVAATDRAKLLVLHAAQSNGTVSAPEGDPAALLNARTVPGLRLDDLLPRERPVDLIKLDVEGAEYRALLGCRETLARWRPAIISEFSVNLLPGISDVSGEHYLRWIAEQGYVFATIQPDGTIGPAGRDPAPILAEHERRGSDHLDILATAT